jgi:hypothetical protein
MILLYLIAPWITGVLAARLIVNAQNRRERESLKGSPDSYDI